MSEKKENPEQYDLGDKPSLTALYMNPTKYCNLRCKHCWVAPPVKTGKEDPLDEMSIDQIINIIKEAEKMGLSHVKITGGEPLLRNDLEKLLKYCFDQYIHFSIETNGTLVTKEMAKMFNEYLVDNISVSLDSAKEEKQDSFRGRKGAFKETVEGIRNLVSEYYSPQVIMSLYRENLEDFDSFLAFMEDQGVDNVKVNTISSVGRGADIQNTELVPTIEEVLEFVKGLDAARERFNGKIYVDVPVAFKDITTVNSDGCSICTIKNILGILSDGTVSICGIGYLDDRLVFGNVKDDPSLLKDIWFNNPVLEKVRKDVPSKLEGVCGMCVFKNRCMGTCRAEVYHNTGNLLASHWFCQESYDAGIFPVTRLVPESMRT